MSFMAVVCAVVIARPAHPEVAQLCDARMCEYDGYHVSYRCYVPRINGTQNRYPLIVWFHGKGEAGTNNADQLAWVELVLRSRRGRRAIPAFLVAMQCPPELAHWGDHGVGTRSAFDQLDVVIQHVCDTEPIDSKRIVLAGISQGASAAWEYVRRHPGRFAGLAALGTNDTAVPFEPSWGQLPVWAFQTTGDGIQLVRTMARRIAALNHLGGDGRLTVIPSPGHDCWSDAFELHGLARWLVAPRHPPRNRWAFRVLVACGLLLMLVALSMMSVLRRRRFTFQ